MKKTGAVLAVIGVSMLVLLSFLDICRGIYNLIELFTNEGIEINFLILYNYAITNVIWLVGTLLLLPFFITECRSHPAVSKKSNIWNILAIIGVVIWIITPCLEIIAGLLNDLFGSSSAYSMSYPWLDSFMRTIFCLLLLPFFISALKWNVISERTKKSCVIMAIIGVALLIAFRIIGVWSSLEWWANMLETDAYNFSWMIYNVLISLMPIISYSLLLPFFINKYKSN